MNKTAIAVVVALVVVAGGFYYYSRSMPAAAGPGGAAGLNGSANQGNLGGADAGVVQQPGADGVEY